MSVISLEVGKKVFYADIYKSEPEVREVEVHKLSGKDMAIVTELVIDPNIKTVRADLVKNKHLFETQESAQTFISMELQPQ